MKKIGKKLSYITKVLLVLGLIISNLSSLKVVFADVGDDGTDSTGEVLSLEGTDGTSLEDDESSDALAQGNGETVSDKVATGLEASISEDNKITVKYGTEVNDTDELEIRVTESYDYNNCVDTDSITCKTVINNSYSVANTDRELLFGDGVVIDYASSLLKSVKFDGTYKLIVTLVNLTEDNKVLDEKVIDEVNNTFDSGILFKVYDSADALVSETDGKYVFGTSDEKIKVVGKMQAGGISPNDVFEYPIGDETTTEYSALEILDKEFEYSINLGGYLYADFKLPVSVVYTKNGEETEYIKQLSISHGTYEDNTKKLNALVDPNKFLFEGTEKDGKLYVYLGEDEITIDDIDKLLYDTYFDSDNVWYSLSNEELNAETLITLEDGITTITYQVVVVGDINGDGVLDEDDIVALANQLVGNEKLDLDKANIDDSDKEANVRDILKLTQIVKTGAWKIEIGEKEVQLDPQLQFQNSEQEITSGDEFEVNYVLVNPEDDVKGFAGLVNYDKSKLELVSMTVVNNFVGSDKDGKFVYVQIKDNETSKDTTNEEEKNVKLLTLKFKALTSGDSQIKIDDPEYFNEDTYYKIVEIDEETGESKPSTKVISLDVTTSQSSDNSLSSLKIGDNEIQLKDGVYDYELTVPNGVTKLDVSALTSNLAASITSIVSPEKLVEGENTITVTVVSESGKENTYTVVVTREKAPEETNNNNDNQTNYQGYTPNGGNNNSHNVKPAEEAKNDDKKDVEPVEPVKEKSNLSKIIIVVLILLVIAGLIYLIFRDDDDEGKKTNKDINKFKKEDFDSPSNNNVNNSNKKNQNKNNKKGR